MMRRKAVASWLRRAPIDEDCVGAAVNAFSDPHEATAAETRSAQQRACNDWVTTFNHVRPHEALGMKTPGEIYRPSPRRPGRIIVGGYPDGCRLMDVSQGGQVNCDGYKIYLSGAFAGYAVGLQGYERGYRVWFYNVLLGTFVPGIHETLQPLGASEG